MTQPVPAPPNAHADPAGSLEQAIAHAAHLLDVDPGLAAEQAEEILRIFPGHTTALRLLAAARGAAGNFQEALAILSPLAQAHPSSAVIEFERGLALGHCGQGEDAIVALKRALQLKPDLPQAWRALGDHLSATGDEAGADAAYANHIQHSTRDPALLNAAAALQANRIPEAEALLRSHLKRSPTDVAAIRMLAEIAVRLGRNDDAEALLARCLQLAPSFHAARYNYAIVLHRSNKPEESLSQLNLLLATDPGNPGYRNLKAVVLCRIGDYDPAIELYEQILAAYPNQSKIWMSFGHALKTAGQQERAIAAYRRSLAIEPGFGEVWWSLANLKTVRFSEQDLATLRQQLAKPDLSIEHRLHLEFAIGKALEDAGDYAASFQHYQQGNALRRSQLRYRAEETSARVARIKRSHGRAFFSQRAGHGSTANDPIFIVGLPRSGSTLLEQILSSHSLVEGTMELPEIISITRDLRSQGDRSQSMPYYDVLEQLDGKTLRDLGEQYIARTRIHRKTDAPFFIDKMPNNFLHVGLIHLILPNAKIIDARRHPLACGFSGFKQHFARGQGFSYSLDDIGRYYHDYVELMAHFDQVLPARIHRVIYEQMVSDTEAEVRRLLDYCGLPFEEGCLRFFENERPVRTASSEQVRQPIYREGIDHWRHYEPWLAPLKAALGPVLEPYPSPPSF